MRINDLAVLTAVVASIAWTGPVEAQTAAVVGQAAAGRALAVQACTGCHVVSADQPFKPEWTGTPHAPDFKDIANRPNLSAAALRHHLAVLPAVPKTPGMANPVLSDDQLRDIVAYIIGLREAPPAR